MGMGVHKIKGEDYYQCREVKAERDRLRLEVDAAEAAYLDGIFRTAERCAQIADEYASVEGVAQKIRDAIRAEFNV